MPKKQTKEGFISKAKAIHGSKYSYEAVNYINDKTKIKIYCNNCKTYFFQNAGSHLQGRGCPVCAKQTISQKRRSNINEFIAKARKIHGNKYDYGLSNYVKSSQKIKIYCNSCKKYFFQTPNKHLEGNGCPYCAGKYTTTDEFIKKSVETHGNKYSYDKTKYINSNTRVKIFCKKCKKYFKQLPSVHLSGRGCPVCARQIIKQKLLSTTEEFIKKACRQHGDKYNYDQIIYKGCKIKIKIFCKKCKKYFEQTPSDHVQGYGCPYCAKQRRIKKQTSTVEEFIKKARKQHNDKYDYSQVNYINSNTCVKIFCKKCKKYFEQIPYNHLKGLGCPFCKQSKGEIFIHDWLNLHDINFISQKRFKDCKDRKPLPFDFYLPDHNTCIEFQGEQHYNSIFFDIVYKSKIKGVEKFKRLKNHDKIKKQYCKNKKIKLLEIKYNDDIEARLNEILKI